MASRIGQRMRRLRNNDVLRGMLSETRLDAGEFVAPVFVRHGRHVVEEVGAMPGVHRYSHDTVGRYAAQLADCGIKSMLIFGIPKSKDSVGSHAYASSGVVPAAIRAVHDSVPSMVVMADVCLCEYTAHGHCGVLKGRNVDNDRTLPLLARAAVQYAKAGADVVAPSAMMDGQVAAIRAGLDLHGYEDTLIMGYSAKYASSFYGPFRSAAGSAPSFGNRRSYQMNPANAREAMREIELDIREGADMVMVKPAIGFLDVISEARKRFDAPLVGYNVSGEYAMVKAASQNGWLDGMAAAEEILMSIKRAGADLVITYHAEELARHMKGK